MIGNFKPKQGLVARMKEAMMIGEESKMVEGVTVDLTVKEGMMTEEEWVNQEELMTIKEGMAVQIKAWI